MQNFFSEFNFKGYINSILSSISGLIYKQKCLVCGCSKENAFVCKPCLKTVEFCTSFEQAKIENIKIYSAFLYEGILKKLIHALKFGHKKGVSKILGKLLYEYFLNTKLENNFIIIPTPSHKQRVLTRGYCQVNLICSEFSKLSNIKINNKILKKIKNSKPQFELNKKSRKENLKGTFGLNLKNYNGENILLVDDITTTGATLEEIINLFKSQNITNITAITLCKTPLK